MIYNLHDIFITHEIKNIFIEKVTGKMNWVVLMVFLKILFPLDPTFSLMFDGCFEEINFTTPSLVSFHSDHKSCHNSIKGSLMW